MALRAPPVRAGTKRPAVVELFTSQGCSSCPPADAYMGELAKRSGVIALTFNVDYWDYLGWRDTLGSPAHSQRQYDYAKSRGDMDVYTPQIIVDGKTHYVGSQKKAVDAAIRRSQESTASQWVPMTMAVDEREVVLSIEAGRHVPRTAVWILPVAPSIAVKIEKGENAGRDIVYSNVVRKIMPGGMWKGEAMSVALPRESILDKDCKACVAFLQTGHVGPVIGATSWGQIGA